MGPVVITIGAAVDWDPASEADEIIQNVRTILATAKASVPLFRDFGVSGDALDATVLQARALYQQQVVEAIRKYEPRAEVVGVDFDMSEGLAGTIKPSVTIRIGVSNA